VISACLIVKNEERWLSGCISCITKLADQIIIADTGSSDKTLEMLAQLNSQDRKLEYFAIPWRDNFGDARNQTITLAKQPWILSFDADERIADRDIETWRKYIQDVSSDSQYEAISIVRRNYIVNPAVSGFIPCKGEYAEEEQNFPGYYEERMVRIFRNLPHIRWRGKLHEMIDPSLKAKINPSTLIFHHYGYTPLEERSRQKRQFYQNYGEQKIKENPKDWKAHLDLSAEYIQAGQMQSAVDVLTRARELNPTEIKVLANLAYALMELGQFDESRRMIDECLKIKPDDHDSLLNLAVGFMRQKKFLQAVNIFQNLLTKHPDSFLALKNQGLCYLHLQIPLKAIDSFEKALQILPSYTEARLDLAVAHHMNKNTPQAYDIVKQVCRTEPQNERALQMVQHFQSLRHQSMG
jgi:tetratricopeptide (TPR) repeat protein